MAKTDKQIDELLDEGFSCGDCKHYPCSRGCKPDGWICYGFESEGEINPTLVKTKVICTGAKTCNMTACEHYHEHEWTPACEGGCFDGGVCVKVERDS